MNYKDLFSHIPVQFIDSKNLSVACNVSVDIMELSKMLQTFEEWSQVVISPGVNDIQVIQLVNPTISSRIPLSACRNRGKW